MLLLSSVALLLVVFEDLAARGDCGATYDEEVFREVTVVVLYPLVNPVVCVLLHDNREFNITWFVVGVNPCSLPESESQEK